LEDLKTGMVNEWINEGIHPITGIKEDYKKDAYKLRNSFHKYDYETSNNI
jgi:hypothetical protein